MFNSKSKHYVHFVWSTKYRAASILPEWRRTLGRFIAKSMENKGCDVIAYEVVANHVHFLAWIPTDVSTGEIAQYAKGRSSRFVNQALDPAGAFRWQDGFGVRSVSPKELDMVVRYIRGQQQRHSDLDVSPDPHDNPDDV